MSHNQEKEMEIDGRNQNTKDRNRDNKREKVTDIEI